MMKIPETDDIFRVLPFCAGTMQKFKSQQVCMYSQFDNYQS